MAQGFQEGGGLAVGGECQGDANLGMVGLAGHVDPCVPHTGQLAGVGGDGVGEGSVAHFHTVCRRCSSHGHAAWAGSPQLCRQPPQGEHDDGGHDSDGRRPPPAPRTDAGSESPADGAEPAPTEPLPEAELLAGDELLPCGRRLSRAREQARDADTTPDPHAAHCPHCRQAVEGLAALDQATRALRAMERPSGHSLADRIINDVRAEVRIGVMLPLDDSALDLQIAESAAAKVLRRAADAVPGARAASCRLTPTGTTTAVHVAMTLASAPDQPLPDKAAQVRRAVLYAADQELGLAITDVDLEIDAVLAPTDAPGGKPSKRIDQP